MLVVWQSGLIVSARWPVTQPVDEVVIKSSAYLMDVVHDLRKRLKAATEPRKVCDVILLLPLTNIMYLLLSYK